MTFSPIVGEAEVVIRANTAGFATSMKAETDSALAGMSTGVGQALDGAYQDAAGKWHDQSGKFITEAEATGMGMGTGLTQGVSKGSEHLGEDATAKLKAQTGKMEGVLGDFQSKWSNTLQGFGVPPALTQGPQAAALAVAAVAAVSLKMASDMQQATTAIANSEQVSVASAQAIGNAFLNTGGSVEFSGIQQARAFAGVAGELKATQGAALTTAQAVSFMGTAADLAKAKQIDLGTATSTLAGVMQAFQINTAGAADAANTLYTASSVTGIAIDSLAASLERVRSRLGTMAPPLKDLTALIVDLTKQGITGRGALTALQGSYTALQGAATGTTKANLLAKQMFADYGIQVVDSTGKLVSMATVIDKLGPKYATMTQAQQLQTSSLLFGSTAAKQMTSVIDAGTKAYGAATEAVSKHNALQKAAEAQAKTLSGQWAILKAAVSDIATRLAEALIPAFTLLLHAIMPVIDAVAKVASWFLQGSPAAIALASAIGLVLLPSIIKLGVEAATTAAKAVVSFVTMGRGIQGFGTTATTTSAEVVTANTEMETSFATLSAGVAADIPMIGTEMATMAAEVEGADAAIVGANEAASASFLGMIGPIGAVAAAGVAAFAGTTMLLNKLKEMATVKPVFVAGSGTLSQEQIVEAYDKAHGIQGNPFSSGNALGPGVFEAADKWYKKQQEAKTKAAEKAAEKAAGVGDQFIAPPVTTKTHAAHASAASKAAKEALKAQNTLTSEVIKALSLPYAEGAKQLELLGVPAKKAADVLHDATLPFTEAVKALEKAGFDASNAVKIADAEMKKNKPTKTKAGAGTTSALPTGFTVNGVPVGGFNLGPGQIKAVATAASGATGSTSTTAPTASAAPTPVPSSVIVNIAQGAVVINPSPGNDHASIFATKGYVESALRTLAREIESGVSNLGQVTR